jgi:hypothetical protein
VPEKMIRSRIVLNGVAKFQNESTDFVSTTREQQAKKQEAQRVFISAALKTPPSGSGSNYGSGGPSFGSVEFAKGGSEAASEDQEPRDLLPSHIRRSEAKQNKTMTWSAEQMAQHSKEQTKMDEDGPFAKANDFGTEWSGDANWLTALKGTGLRFTGERGTTGV